MRRLLPLLPALLSLALPTLARADDPTPAVDLVAMFVLGAEDHAIVAIMGDSAVSAVTQTGPGVFDLSPEGKGRFEFKITDKGGCIYDIAFSQDGKVAGGIEIDANKLKTVTYDKVGEKDNFVDYKVTLVGDDKVVQLLGPDGALSATDPSSSLSTSVYTDDMQAAVTEFQSTYCKAAA